ncbi:MAG: DNA-directed DNA polymerase II small subunit [Asgard group archaeon]|nr:DNA-directed DNA polymerase II small subunit [Asgard group archaeon]
MTNKRTIIQELFERNCLITPESFEMLQKLNEDTIDVKSLAQLLENEIVITPELLEEALSSLKKESSHDLETRIGKPDEKKLQTESLGKNHSKMNETGTLDLKVNQSTQETKFKTKPRTEKEITYEFEPLGKKVKSDIRVTKDTTKKSAIEGEITDFQTYFYSRYKQLSSILRKRGDLRNAMKIRDIHRIKQKNREQLVIIAMVTEKTTLRNGGIILELEDPTDSISASISSKKEELLLKAGKLLEDQVAGFFGRFYQNRFYIDDFVFPDIPMVSTKMNSKEPVSVCMTSDLHIGSQEFLEDSFLELINFLHGKADSPYHRKIASQIKYLLICGDLVDGIGVYPGQKKDLIIPDIYGQYDHAAELLAKVPDWIHIVIISGNHDACRLALPQPAIGKSYAKKLYELPNVSILSNPATFELHGKRFLMYHGNSFEDITSLTPGLNMNEPNGPMIYSLRFRHLAPTFGRRTSIIPSKKDDLVINTVPDVFHTGHIHINSHTHYRGVQCINSGTFQSQTDFMISKNINPTPGRVPILNLQTNKLQELIFYESSEVKQ